MHTHTPEHHHHHITPKRSALHTSARPFWSTVRPTSHLQLATLMHVSLSVPSPTYKVVDPCPTSTLYSLSKHSAECSPFFFFSWKNKNFIYKIYFLTQQITNMLPATRCSFQHCRNTQNSKKKRKKEILKRVIGECLPSQQQPMTCHL